MFALKLNGIIIFLIILVWNINGLVSLTRWKTTFSLFQYCFYIYLNASHYGDTLFPFTLFLMSQIVLYFFFTYYSCTLFYIDLIFTLSIRSSSFVYCTYKKMLTVYECHDTMLDKESSQFRILYEWKIKQSDNWWHCLYIQSRLWEPNDYRMIIKGIR